MKLICAHKLSECLNFVSLFITPSKGVLPYNSVCLGLRCWSTQFFVNSLPLTASLPAYTTSASSASLFIDGKFQVWADIVKCKEIQVESIGRSTFVFLLFI